LTGELPIKPAHKEIDVYSTFTDRYYTKPTEITKPAETKPSGA
jgi:transcription elongation factor Elf1